MASKVYWADLRADFHENLQQKLTRLMKTAGMGEIDFDRKFVAIKMHFGEPGNLAFLRPNWAKTVADFVKERGGKPFLTDCNTLYVGGRKNGLDHLDTACLNGFNPLTTGCQVIIADGIKGSDEVAVPVVGGQLVKEAKIGRAVMDADVFISLTHFKGHEQAGMGGALKNIGMGCGSRAGKMEQHNSGKPFVKQKKCIGCRACARICAHGAPQFGADGKATIDTDKCVGCARCLAVCPKDAIQCLYDEAPAILNKKIAEYTKAVVEGRPPREEDTIRTLLRENAAHKVYSVRSGGRGMGDASRGFPAMARSGGKGCLASGSWSKMWLPWGVFTNSRLIPFSCWSGSSSGRRPQKSPSVRSPTRVMEA